MASLREIGQALKQAREAQGLSLDDVSGRTRVTVRHLMALEEGNEGDLPEVFYVRGFIKKYAEVVGLNPAEMADAYRSAPIPQPAATTAGVSVGPIAYYLLIAGVIVAVLALAWHFQPRVSVVAESPSPSPAATASPVPTAPPSPASVATGEASPAPAQLASSAAPVAAEPSATAPASPAAKPSPSVAPAVAPSASASPAAKPSPTARPSAKPSVKPTARPTPRPTPKPTARPTSKPTPRPTPTPRPSNGAAGKQVTLFVQERAWVEVLVDGQVAFEGLMLPGASRRFEGRSVEVTAGNAGGIRVSVNGKDHGLLGERGVVVTHTF